MPKHTLPNDITLYYEQAGDHPPEIALVVLLHGLGSSTRGWEFQIPVLAAHCRVLAIDVRGHGQSDKPNQRYDIGEMAADIAMLLESLGEEPAHIVGLSLGGILALQLGAAHPERVRSLVLANSYAKLQLSGWRSQVGELQWARALQRAQALFFNDMRLLGQVIADRLFPLPEQHELREAAIEEFAANPTLIYHRMLLTTMRINLLDQLRKVQRPTLVVAGERDNTVPMVYKETLHAGIAGSRIEVVPDSGHATPLDQPDYFNRLVLDFIARH